ncbi:hypothetical protein M413DRAFT_236346 [Hebeloma cylindrosporum]|uniref:F-box domain-containing protein n=1 Tax=Hebeloma cylindrosporum TaxID=76867 RepID=A0A0C3C4H0_HEBCY|nr:hypothetical protein M413DRAFT_236346 [Hebeloma cylindrosporum h7]
MDSKPPDIGTLETLPAEIVDLIIDNLRQEAHQKDARKALLSCSLVSKALCVQAYSTLFEEVRISIKPTTAHSVWSDVMRRTREVFVAGLSFPTLAMIYRIKSFHLEINIMASGNEFLSIANDPNFLGFWTLSMVLDMVFPVSTCRFPSTTNLYPGGNFSHGLLALSIPFATLPISIPSNWPTSPWYQETFLRGQVSSICTSTMCLLEGINSTLISIPWSTPIFASCGRSRSWTLGTLTPSSMYWHWGIGVRQKSITAGLSLTSKASPLATDPLMNSFASSRH